ncbi:hypothetical protein Pmani_009397 [Petrolisthes manimaculis]|uniref:Sodium channel and clathrin linker 1 n=1 Tax=Petrolisthes manimaculis TaxID=1843537 RepID=A0AAE1UDQ5_9EUCA|nr:hypothetical protein Pmani_009397 [Petrolisthes manimaculis]
MIGDVEREVLLEEYDQVVQRQTALLRHQQATIDSLREELSTQQELAVAAGKKQQVKVEALLQQSRTAALEEAGEELQVLRQEKDAALKERELCEAEVRRHALEVQRLQQAYIVNTAAANVKQPTSKLEEDYQRVIQAIEEEMGRLRDETDKAEEEKMSVLKLNFELRKEVASLMSQKERARDETEAVKQEVEEKESEVREARAATDSLTTKLLQQEEDVRILVAHLDSLKKNKEHLEGVLHKVRSRLQESHTRVAQSVRTAEDSLREKDAALLREKHIREEVRRLEATLGSVGEEAGKRAQEEVEKIRQQHNTSIKNLTEELTRIEMALNEKQLECERARAIVNRTEMEMERLEAEIARTKQERKKEATTTVVRTTNLEVRVHQLEDEVERWKQEANRIMSEADDQRSEMGNRVEELEERLSSIMEDCAAAKLETRRAVQSAASHASTLTQMERETAARLDHLQKQLRAKAEECERLSKSAKVRLEAAEGTHKDALKQAYQNMAALQENYARLQDQVNKERNEWNERASELMNRLEKCREEGRKAVQGRRDTETKLAVAREQVLQYKARVEEVEECLRAAERRYTSVKLGVINTTNYNIKESVVGAATYLDKT